MQRNLQLKERIAIIVTFIIFFVLTALAANVVITKKLDFTSDFFLAFLFYSVTGILYPTIALFDLISDLFLEQARFIINTIIVGFSLIIVLGGIVLNQGLAFTNVDQFRAFLSYSFLFITISFSVFIIILLLNIFVRKAKQENWFIPLIFRPQLSTIQFWWENNKNDPIARFLKSMIDNPLLAILYPLILFLPLAFIGALFAPQSAIGTIFSNYIFPVQPQTAFSIDSGTAFLMVKPAFDENSAHALLLTVAFSIVLYLYRRFGEKPDLKFSVANLILLGIIFSGTYWLLIHEFVSQGQEFNRVGHFIFGSELGVLTIATGQAGPGLSLHVSNLVFYTIRDALVSNEFLRVGLQVLAGLIFAVTLTIVLIRRRKK